MHKLVAQDVQPVEDEAQDARGVLRLQGLGEAMGRGLETLLPVLEAVDAIVMHIKDQGSFAIMFYDDMDAAEKTAVVHEIASYALSLITGLMGVKAERNDSNVALDGEAPPVLPAQLVKLRPGAFVQDVLEPFRIHIAKFWTP